MSEEIIRLAAIFVIVAAIVSGIFRGLAAIIGAWFNGRAAVIRAQRGDPPSSSDETPLPTVLRSVLRVRQTSNSHPTSQNDE